MSKTIQPHEITSLLEEELANFDHPSALEEVGTVLEVGDGVALVYGLQSVQAGEIVLFEGGQKGLALNLNEEHIGVIILDDPNTIKERDHVKRTHRISSIKVGDGIVGRIVNTLGKPVDGQGAITGELFEMALERNAPNVISREPVHEPLQTGIITLDALISMGRGQRQLLLGNRQTGKTTIAIDTILNQRQHFEAGNPVYCIYVAIGQKASTVARIAAILKKHGALDYTTIVLASASSPASLQYLAPFAGVTIGEYFRDTGRHALVILDDLSKHAISYREISLLLKRVPGREAFPGDIFYLHSRLLERAAKIIANDEIARQMNDLPPSIKGIVKGGGSLTALPIIETQEGDVSAYIPTNVISITDGQTFLETGLFNAGVRPAINIGLSVSRVGSAAQLKAMKQVAGKFKLDQAQFLDTEAFAKFGSELDPTAQRIIDRGRRNRVLLNQSIHEPMPVAHQIATIYASVNGFLDSIPLDKIKSFAVAYIGALITYDADLLTAISQGSPLTKDFCKKLNEVAEEVVKKYQGS